MIRHCIQAFLLVCTFVVPVFAVERPESVPDTAGVEEHLGQFVELGLVFRNAQGEKIQVKDVLKKDRPAIVVPVYFNCPRMCPLLLGHVRQTINTLDLELGSDYSLLTVSFDSGDNPEIAAEKKAQYVASLEKGSEAWHFLTGEQSSIEQLMSEIGFGFSKDGVDFIHSAVMIVLSPDGKISRYFYGFKPNVKHLRLALIDAASGKIGETLDRIFLYCFRYDHTDGQYTLAIMNVIRAISLVVFFGLAMTLITFFIQERA